MKHCAGWLLLLASAGVQAAEPVCVDTAGELASREGPRAGSAKSLRREFYFAKLAGCLRQDGGTRRLLRISLGEFLPPVALTIEAVARREGVLAPEVRIFDRSGQEIARYGFDAFRQRGADFAHTLFLNDDAARDGYLLIGNDPANAGGSGKLVSGNRYATPIITPLIIGHYSNGYESRRELPYRDAGLVRVQMQAAQQRVLP